MKMKVTCFVALFFFFGVILLSGADKIDDANRYMDQVLSVYATDTINMKVYEMPNFSTNYQNRSSDGRITTSKIYYYAGYLTGMQNVFRKSCRQPSWDYGNVTVTCNVAFPEVTFKYEARIHSIFPIPDGVRVRQFDFNVTGEIRNMEASITITSSPHVNIPSIKHFNSTDAGQPSFKFRNIQDLSYEILVTHFYHKFKEILLEKFYDDYRQAFERSVASVPYPFEQ